MAVTSASSATRRGRRSFPGLLSAPPCSASTFSAARGEAIYLNNASTGPLPERTLGALREFDARRAAPYRLSDDLQFATLARGRELIARLIGAEASEIGLAVNTSYGINLAAFSLPL